MEDFEYEGFVLFLLLFHFVESVGFLYSEYFVWVLYYSVEFYFLNFFLIKMNFFFLELIKYSLGSVKLY